MIAEYLLIGRENAQTGKELARALNCDIREITEKIERERRQGQPIIASCDASNPGYYLAATADEVQQYCGKLFHRAGEIHKTRNALLATAATLPAEEPQEAQA